MADIYQEGETPVLDYAEAARSLAGLKHLGNDKAKADAVARVTAAALLDIAVTLNAILSGFATGGIWPDDDSENDDEREVGPDGEPLGEPERTGEDDPDAPLDIDDRVVAHPDGSDDREVPGTIIALGESEGEGWAEVSWDVEPTEPGGKAFVTRVWVDQLRRQPVDETENGDAILAPGELFPLVKAALEEGDDPDADFDDDAIDDGELGPLTTAGIKEAHAAVGKIKKSKKGKS